MSSFIEVALGGFCQPAYSLAKLNGLVRKEDGNKSTLNDLTDSRCSFNIGGIENLTQRKQFLQNSSTYCCSPSTLSFTLGFNRNLKSSILDAFQTSVAQSTSNQMSALKANMPSTRELYKPPPLNKMAFFNNLLGESPVESLVTYPGLTPPNARLLENKQSKSETLLDEVKRCGGNRDLYNEKWNVCDNGLNADSNNLNNSSLCNKDIEKAQYHWLKKEDNMNTDICSCSQTSAQLSATECDKCINSTPICLIETDNISAVDTIRNDQHCVANTDSKTLVNSFCSFEMIIDQVDTNTFAKNSSPNGNNPASENYQMQGGSNFVPNHRRHQTHKHKNMHRHRIISSVLIHSSGRRNRPTSKKHRQHKAQQNEHVTDSKCDSIKNTNLDQGSAYSQNSSVGFILGIDPNSLFMDSLSLPLCSEINSDSYWSDSDEDSDEQYSFIENECKSESLLNFTGTDLLAFRNFGIPCSAQLKPSSIIDAINLKWNIKESDEPEYTKSSNSENSNSKKVHFPDDINIACIHPIVAWSYAYQTARKGPWEQYARDHERFQHRIINTEPLLALVLDRQHRNNVYNMRFSRDLS